jgi:serine protease AprX
MAIKRVIAFFMHEYERDGARSLMPNAVVTDGYVCGEIDDSMIANLKNTGVIVQELESRPEAQRRRVPFARPLMRAGLIAALPQAAAPVPDMTRAQYYRITLKYPVMDVVRNQLEGMNVRLLQSEGVNTYTVRLEPQQVGPVAALAFVERVELYSPEDADKAVVSEAQRPAAAVANTGAKMLQFDIRLHRPEDLPVVINWLRARTIDIRGNTSRKIRIYLLENSPDLDDLPLLPEVASVQEYVPPKWCNDRARILLNIDSGGASGPLVPQTGAGQIVAVADTGIDDQHPDFQGRIIGQIARGRPGNCSDPHGHGTHVSGSVLGGGTAGPVRGAAPGASLFMQSLLDAQGGLGGLPLDLNELFDEAYQAGARIHNNSWGAATASRYTIDASEVDEFVANHPDMLIVISAGNEGVAYPHCNSAAGYVDWLSIGSPASCKNALTVGASRSDRTSGGYSTMTWGQAWPSQFPDSPIAAERISSNPECLAAFSSRGPCDDHRIKPDVVAPGTDILSTKSSAAPIASFWGSFPGNNHYAYMGGTSMAAPLVSGCAALVREYFASVNHQPSAALLKAVLINGAQWLSGADATAPHNGTPNYHQGFGRVSIADSIPNPSRPGFTLRFVDLWQQPAAKFSMSGQRHRFQFNLPGPASEIRICMAYTDPPARGLQNNLNLFVQRPDGMKMLGNAQLPNSLNIPDPDNNVEVVRILNAPAGPYLIQISATNLLKTPQDYALVVTGINVPQLIQV